MNKYERKPDQIIDLHGYTVKEALATLLDLIEQGKALHVRVIVGKGIHSQGAPVLREKVKDFLSAHRIKHNQSKIEHGGEGSIEVYLGDS